MLPWSFEPETVTEEPTGNAPSIPAGVTGNYTINKAEVEQKDSGSVMIDFQFIASGGKYDGAYVFYSINLVKKNGETNDIGKHQVEWLAKQAGIAQRFDDPSVLVGRQISFTTIGKNEEYQGVIKEKILPSKIRPAGNQTQSQPQQQQNTGQSPFAQVAQQASSAVANDEIPF